MATGGVWDLFVLLPRILGCWVFFCARFPPREARLICGTCGSLVGARATAGACAGERWPLRTGTGITQFCEARQVRARQVAVGTRAVPRTGDVCHSGAAGAESFDGIDKW